jgi:membrane protein implicated in regulation of membrane protease activity
MEWWLWLSVGLFLLGLEMFTPTGMYLLIIGLSFMVVGGLTSIGIVESLQSQTIFAAIITLFFIFTIRKPFHALLKGMTQKTGSNITSQTVTITENIAPGALGKGELSGSSWSVKNETSVILEAGSRHNVASVNGLTLVVK